MYAYPPPQLAYVAHLCTVRIRNVRRERRSPQRATRAPGLAFRKRLCQLRQKKREPAAHPGLLCLLLDLDGLLLRGVGGRVVCLLERVELRLERVGIFVTFMARNLATEHAIEVGADHVGSALLEIVAEAAFLRDLCAVRGVGFRLVDAG